LGSVSCEIPVAGKQERRGCCAKKEFSARIAENIAKRVTADGQKVELDSFSAFERKLVHEYISANYPSLTSFSEGEGLDRKLVIALKTS
jgi:spoIIIJ-associated protein